MLSECYLTHQHICRVFSLNDSRLNVVASAVHGNMAITALIVLQINNCCNHLQTWQTEPGLDTFYDIRTGNVAVYSYNPGAHMGHVTDEPREKLSQ